MAGLKIHHQHSLKISIETYYKFACKLITETHEAILLNFCTSTLTWSCFGFERFIVFYITFYFLLGESELFSSLLIFLHTHYSI